MAQAPMSAFVKLLVQDPAESKGFYEKLGFAVVHSDPVFTHLRWAEHANLFLVSAPPFVALQAPRGGGVLLCFSAGPLAKRPGLEELVEAAKSLRAKVDGPRTEPWFTREMIITDPDGYRLNFVEPAGSGSESTALSEAS
ncbi:MAG: VOC family protein [Myxococcaceae bacterium]